MKQQILTLTQLEEAILLGSLKNWLSKSYKIKTNLVLFIQKYKGTTSHII